METMKFYTEEEILDKHIGKKGTPKRDQFEADLNSFLIGFTYQKRVKFFFVGITFGSTFFSDVFIFDFFECIKFLCFHTLYLFELK